MNVQINIRGRDNNVLLRSQGLDSGSSFFICAGISFVLLTQDAGIDIAGLQGHGQLRKDCAVICLCSLKIQIGSFRLLILNDILRQRDLQICRDSIQITALVDKTGRIDLTCLSIQELCDRTFFCIFSLIVLESFCQGKFLFRNLSCHNGRSRNTCKCGG